MGSRRYTEKRPDWGGEKMGPSTREMGRLDKTKEQRGRKQREQNSPVIQSMECAGAVRWTEERGQRWGGGGSKKRWKVS